MKNVILFICFLLIYSSLFSQEKTVYKDYIKPQFGFAFFNNYNELNEFLGNGFNIPEKTYNFDLSISMINIVKNKLKLSYNSSIDMTSSKKSLSNSSASLSTYYMSMDLNYYFFWKKINVIPFIGFGMNFTTIKLFNFSNKNNLSFANSLNLTDITNLTFTQAPKLLYQFGFNIEYMINKKSAISMYFKYRNNFGSDDVYLFNRDSKIIDFPAIENNKISVGAGICFYTNRWD